MSANNVQYKIHIFILTMKR